MRIKVTHRCSHAIEPFIKFISFFIAHVHTKATLKWGEISGAAKSMEFDVKDALLFLGCLNGEYIET